MKPRSSLSTAPLIGKYVTVYFDGGCAGKQGVTGSVLYDAEGVQVDGIGIFYGDVITTNNEAEVVACRDALALVLSNRDRLGAKKVRFIGDSDLVIKFLRGQAKPGKPFLQDAVKAIKARI